MKRDLSFNCSSSQKPPPPKLFQYQPTHIWLAVPHSVESLESRRRGNGEGIVRARSQQLARNRAEESLHYEGNRVAKGGEMEILNKNEQETRRRSRSDVRGVGDVFLYSGKRARSFAEKLAVAELVGGLDGDCSLGPRSTEDGVRADVERGSTELRREAGC